MAVSVRLRWSDPGLLNYRLEKASFSLLISHFVGTVLCPFLLPFRPLRRAGRKSIDAKAPANCHGREHVKSRFIRIFQTRSASSKSTILGFRQGFQEAFERVAPSLERAAPPAGIVSRRPESLTSAVRASPRLPFPLLLEVIARHRPAPLISRLVLGNAPLFDGFLSVLSLPRWRGRHQPISRHAKDATWQFCFWPISVSVTSASRALG